MATMTDNVIAAISETRPPMLEKGMYDSWKTRIILYIRGKENGEMLKDSIDNGPYQFKSEITVKDTDGVTEIRHPQRLEDLAGEDKLCYDSDIKAVNILLLGLPVDIYTLINHYQTAKEIRDHVKELMEGTEMTKQEFQCIAQTFLPQITNFELRLVQELKLQFKTAKLRFRMFKVSQGYAGNAGNNQASRVSVIYTVGNAWANQPRVVRCYNCNGEAQEAGAVLNEEQHDFLVDSLEETDDCEDLKLQATTNFKANHIDAYDLDCDDEATTNAIFMANLSHVGSLNDDTVEPHYDSHIQSEVLHYDTYHDSDMLNSNIQELGYIENIVSNDKSYDECGSLFN
ncbi:hypothetical protein Tco_0270420 [Tanacetum coccineum]